MIMQHKGIDVSSWNGEIDWKAVADSGVEFAMIRAGTGSRSGTVRKDAFFEQNIADAYANGIFCGVYLYSYADSVESARGEAQALLKMIMPHRSRIRFPVAYDMEENSRTSLGADTLTRMANAFCGEIRGAGFRPMVYANLNWLRNYLRPSEIAADIWLAQWASRPTWTGDYRIWQYSDSGTVPGIRGNADLDYSDTLYESAAEPPLTAEEAISRLADAEVLNSPDYWREAAAGKITASAMNVSALLVKAAGLL